MYTNFHWIGGRGLGALQTLVSVLLSYVVYNSKVRKIQPQLPFSLSSLHLLFLARNKKMTSIEAGVRLRSGFGV